MTSTIRDTYNFGGAFCYFVPYFSARMLNRDYHTGTFDLADLALHNGIEHDASLTRHDTADQPDQAAPVPELVEELLRSASGTCPHGALLTREDLSKVLGQRRAHCRAHNHHFTTSKFHDIFGASKCVCLLVVTWGKVRLMAREQLGDDADDLRRAGAGSARDAARGAYPAGLGVAHPVCPGFAPTLFETISNGPFGSERFGLTMAQFNLTVLPVEFGAGKVDAKAKKD